jgi:hypothetical protein
MHCLHQRLRPLGSNCCGHFSSCSCSCCSCSCCSCCCCCCWRQQRRCSQLCTRTANVTRVRRRSRTTSQLSHATRQSSHVTRPTCHTSHLTPHTSHLTPLTSQAIHCVSYILVLCDVSRPNRFVSIDLHEAAAAAAAAESVVELQSAAPPSPLLSSSLAAAAAAAAAASTPPPLPPPCIAALTLLSNPPPPPLFPPHGLLKPPSPPSPACLHRISSFALHIVAYFGLVSLDNCSLTLQNECAELRRGGGAAVDLEAMARQTALQVCGDADAW